MQAFEYGLYIHVPFCKSRCTYCDFVSYTDFSLVKEYFEAVKIELEMWSKELEMPKVTSIYVGGGTPSDVDFEYLSEILLEVEKLFALDNPEITVEINPKCSFIEKLAESKVNRISVGLQAADDNVLKKVKRRHSVSDFKKTWEIVCKYFENTNVDFIVGLPAESDLTILNNIEIVRTYKPKHVAVYVLEKENDIRKTLEDEAVCERYERFLQALEEMGYVRYEISNFSLPGYECKHNMKYWKNENYVGVGVSAGGHIGFTRYVNTKDLKLYIKMMKAGKHPYEYYQQNDPFQEAKETIFMGLRIAEGVDLEKIKKLLPELNVRNLVEGLYDFVEFDEKHLRLSKKGMNQSGWVIGEIVRRLNDHRFGMGGDRR
ncbi:radical SAM family heme chaperone HemW [Pseudothermotoga thermarum]|uniref:Heme chaperone HemW n=1 Tax=Pseudothermotoga thermarum DSM 5069 TaxID=688269 RepID=F7YYJ0_9THEM|nr:radical SAM family heme chaperone HemW [Pseudothermotoga thermarum]AEH51019.1 oxygen-independent coproporphyrinogen III oxidase [Pseudothermotoga thermarum DSM 5069]